MYTKDRSYPKPSTRPINPKLQYFRKYTQYKLNLGTLDYKVLSEDAYYEYSTLTLNNKDYMKSNIHNRNSCIEHIVYNFNENNYKYTGYFGKAHIFLNKYTYNCSVVFAHKGTDLTKTLYSSYCDLFSDTQILFKTEPFQVYTAQCFVRDMVYYCNRKGLKVRHIEHTGHSLGGAIATIVNAKERHNASFTIESPGVGEIIASDGLHSYAHALRTNTSYKAKSSWVNSINHNVGNVCQTDDIKGHGIGGFSAKNLRKARFNCRCV